MSTSSTEKELPWLGRVLNKWVPWLGELGPNVLTGSRPPSALVAAMFILFDLFGNPGNIGEWLLAMSAATDLDGNLARITGNTSEWGRIWDPRADFFLHVVSMVLLLSSPEIHLFVKCSFFLLVFLGIWSFLARRQLEKAGTIVRTSWWGKFAAAFLMVSVSVYFLMGSLQGFYVIYAVSFLLTVYANVKYLIDARRAI